MADLFWVLFTGIVAAIPPLLIKEFTQQSQTNPKRRWWLILASAVLYMMLILGYAKVLAKHPVGIYYVLLKVISIFTVLLVAFMFFKEKLTPLYIVGIVFGVIAVVILSS